MRLNSAGLLLRPQLSAALRSRLLARRFAEPGRVAASRPLKRLNRQKFVALLNIGIKNNTISLHAQLQQKRIPPNTENLRRKLLRGRGQTGVLVMEVMMRERQQV